MNRNADPSTSGSWNTPRLLRLTGSEQAEGKTVPLPVETTTVGLSGAPS